MWNFNFVLPSLLVLVIIMIYYFARPRLPIRLNRAFLRLIAVDASVIVTDVLSSRADERYQSLPQPLVVLLNLLFFVAFLARIFAFFQFSMVTLRLDKRYHSWGIRLTRVVFYVSEAIVLSSPLTGAVFTIDAAGYHRGPLYVILPVCAFFYLLLGIALLLIFRKRLRRGALISSLAFHFVLIVGNVARILYPQYLVMNLFCLLAVIIIYLAFQNPDLYISDRGPAFNLHAFSVWLDDPLRRRDDRILGFVLRDYNDERGIYGGAQMDQGLGLIIAYLVKRWPHFLVFYLRNGCFAIAGPGNTDWERVRQDIAARFRQPWQADNADLYLHASFVELSAASRADTADRIVSTLLIALDRAAQNAETDECLLSEDLMRDIDRQMEIKRCLERALERHEMEVFLQPLMDGGTQRLVAAEALARLRNEDGSLIPPDAFIPVAEKNGHITMMGEQVLRKVCRFIRDHDTRAMGLRWINVNLSPIQCMRSDLAERFSGILTEYGVSPELIHLEITEQSMIDFSLLEKQIESLRRRGFQFALDDYGAGYSNLSRVIKYPFTNIKLDMEIVWDYIKNRDLLLPTLIQAFRQMGFTITAEGIETREMAEAMNAIHCDYLQGYYFSRPIGMEEFVEKYAKTGEN